MNLHLKLLLINRFRHEMLTQRFEAMYGCTNFAWIYWIVVSLDYDPVPRNTRRLENHMPQSSCGTFVDDLSGASVEKNDIGIVFCDRHFPTQW